MSDRLRKSHSGHRERAVLAADTTRDAERVQVARWRRMSPDEKCRAVSEISRAAQELSLLGIRRRHPEASERECFLRLAVMKLGRDLARIAYPEISARLGD